MRIEETHGHVLDDPVYVHVEISGDRDLAVMLNDEIRQMVIDVNELAQSDSPDAPGVVQAAREAGVDPDAIVDELWEAEASDDDDDSE